MRRFVLALSGAVGLCACANGDDPNGVAPAAPPASSSSTVAQADDEIAQGRQLANAYCTSCHAVGAEVMSPNANAPPFRTLSQRYPGALLADAFPERMRVGHPAMPDFGFTDAQIDALLAYLLSIQERQGA